MGTLYARTGEPGSSGSSGSYIPGKALTTVAGHPANEVRWAVLE
jgi:hypothetical protein